MQTTTPITNMPVVDSPLDPEVADGLGNEMLLTTAATTKIQRVAGTRPSVWANQSGGSRAWTNSGNVD